MTDWEDLRHLAALADAGTLAGAARLLRVEHATVARRIAALEIALDAKLVDRRGRKIELTAVGSEVASKAIAMKGVVLGIERVAAGSREELRGTVTVSAPPALSAALLGPAFADLRRAHPGIVLHIIGENRKASLDRREADLALRLGRPSEGELLIRKVGQVVFRPYAHPAYLDRTPEQDRGFIGFDAPMDSAPQQLALKRIAGPRPIVARASTLEVQAALAEAKVGIAMLPEILTRGRPLVATADEGLAREVWLVVHSDLSDSAPVRAVSDSLGTALAVALAA